MANVVALRSVSNSLVQFLSSSFPEELDQAIGPVTFRLLSSTDLADPGLALGTSVSLYLYRVTVNSYLRNTRPHHARPDTTPLPLNLHYLLSAWSDSADSEQVLLAWAMRHLHEHPVLDRSSLNPDGDWANDEVIHVAPEELTNEDVLRLWETFAPTYRLSYSYVARVVLIESDEARTDDRVVAVRFRHQERS